MGASKKSSAGGFAAFQLVRVLMRPQYRGLVLVALVVFAALAGALYAWHRVGREALEAGRYSLPGEQISVTPQPAWIHSSVKAEVIRSAGLDRLDVRDVRLVEHVAEAFSLHPWIKQVVRVEKRFPPAVDVEVAWRAPVAVVEIAARGEAGLLFVDSESVLLPSADFSPSQAKDFLRIVAGSDTPAGPYGTAWGSERVAGAARIAAAFGSRWKALGLYRIAAVESSSGDLVFELRTREDARVVWGSTPGREATGEPPAEQKIVTLEQLVADKGPLDRPGAASVIDLRQLARTVPDRET